MAQHRSLSRIGLVGAGIATVSLAACVNPQCVGDRLEANLSLGQLQQLGRAAKASREGDTTPGRLTASDFVRVSGQVKDPKVPLEVGKAAAACGILTDPASPL
jgi:hypothetical protein